LTIRQVDPAPTPLVLTCADRRGTRQVRHRYTPGPLPVAGGRPGRGGSGTAGGAIRSQVARRPGRGDVANHSRRQRRLPNGTSGRWPGAQDERHASSGGSCDGRGPRTGIIGDLSGLSRLVTGRITAPCQGSKRFGEPLLLPGRCPPCVRNHCYTAAYGGTSWHTAGHHPDGPCARESPGHGPFPLVVAGVVAGVGFEPT
jgi:hypothetical protein